jgi:lysophospholipase L1-like esterase
MMRSPKTSHAWLLAALLLSAAAHAADGRSSVNEIPALAEWKDAAYTQRYFLRVEAPGEAGNVNLQSDPVAASVVLPLKMITTPSNGKVRPEPVLLIGEDGGMHSAHLAPVGNEVEVSFTSRPGLRRFCLYAGAPVGQAKKASSAAAEFTPIKVKARGRIGPADFVPTEAPITLEKFKKIEESGDPGLGTRVTDNISEIECPFIDIKTTQFGHILKVTNPERYTALYEAFIRAPASGEYKFSVDTPGVAHLLINGVPLIAAETPDPRRLPYALTGTVNLNEGMHRITLYYTEACNEPGRTNAELRRFGFRLHWKPPFAQDMMCVPAQAFPHALPAVVTRSESAADVAQPFTHIEKLAHVRTGSHLGSQKAVERALVVIKPSSAPQNARVSISAAGMNDVTLEAADTIAQWVPTDTDVKISFVADGKVLGARTIRLPSSRVSPTTKLLDLEGELQVKSAPEFLYPDEIGQIHLEAQLSPAPILVYKERLESNMMPPAPRPLGQFRLQWHLVDTAAKDAKPESHELEVTPLESARKKIRVSLPADIEKVARSGQMKFEMQLTVGGVEIETHAVRLLHSLFKWPGVVEAAPGSLLYHAEGAAVAAADPKEVAKGAEAAGVPEISNKRGEHVVMVVPYENESEYRKFAPLKKLAHSDLGKEVLFLGDPLVEGITPKPGELYGVAKALSKAMPQLTWSNVPVTGPHRNLPIFRMLADFDSYLKSRENQKAPDLVIVCLGGGDVARQTPLHTFERALDALIDRVRSAGAKKVLVVGAIPEPWREKQCATYQERISDMLRQHHIDCLDIFNTWTKESDWIRYFSTDGTETNPVYGPVPNAAARERIAQMIKDRL